MIENYTGKGTASQLTKKLANWFTLQNAHKICVDPGDDMARNFYKKNGAENLNTHWMFWQDIRSTLS